VPDLIRGEVYFADLNPPPGTEPGTETTGPHPVLILQNTRLNRSLPTVVVVPITSSPRAARYPTSVHIPPGAGRLREGYVLCPQIRVLDKRRIGDRIGQVPASIVDATMRMVQEILSRDDPSFLTPRS
jgi:mRNA interferase MazF